MGKRTPKKKRDPKRKPIANKTRRSQAASPRAPRARARPDKLDDATIGDDGLTDKQRAFVNFYLGHAHFNATEAAKRSGYKGNRVTLASVGYENLRKPQIAKCIEAKLKELAMGPDEVLAHLTETARNEASRYVVVRYGQPAIDVAAMIKDGKQHLIKGITYTRSGTAVVELYDAQSAQVHLGRHHALFTDKLEMEEPVLVKLDR